MCASESARKRECVKSMERSLKVKKMEQRLNNHTCEAFIG